MDACLDIAIKERVMKAGFGCMEGNGLLKIVSIHVKTARRHVSSLKGSGKVPDDILRGVFEI